MSLAVTVEIEALQLCTQIHIVQNPFGSVAERQHREPIGTYWYLGGHLFQFRVAQGARSRIFPQPIVGYPGTVDAHQHTHIRLLQCVIDMSKTIDPRKWVKGSLIGNGIHYAGSTSGSCNFTRLQHIEGKGIVGLVASTVSHRNTDAQT